MARRTAPGRGAAAQRALDHPAGEPGAAPAPLLEGHDFYASPRISANGDRLAFLAWDLPAMPWDAARLFVAGLAKDARAGEPFAVAGGDGSACFSRNGARMARFCLFGTPAALGSYGRGAKV